MAKKKARAALKKKVGKKKATKLASKKKKPAPAKKKVAKRKKVVAKKAASRRSVAKKKPTKKSSVKRKKAKKSASLGRPRVTGEAKLEQFFHKDYEARQVFDFLGVNTVKELEQHSPKEIVDRLTAPVIHTVNRIRTALAMSNRSLADDREYALEFKKRYSGMK